MQNGVHFLELVSDKWAYRLNSDFHASVSATGRPSLADPWLQADVFIQCRIRQMLTLWMLPSRKRPILPAERVAHTVMQNALNCSSQFIQNTVSNWNMLIFNHTFLNLQAQQSFNLCVLQFGKTLDCRAQIALKKSQFELKMYRLHVS